MRWIRDKWPALYVWMLKALPRRLMYTRVMKGPFDSGILWPRWGFTEQQIVEAKRDAEEIYNNINWDDE